MFNLIRCVAETIAEVGLKGLASMVPGGSFAVAVAEGILKKVRGSSNPAEVAAGVAATAGADSAKTAEEVQAAVPAVPAGAATAAEIVDLKLYLTQIPQQVRQSLKRAEDPSGKTVPGAFALTTPEDVLKLLPPRPPRFRPGDTIPGRNEWVLERVLGIGGFGEVWRARHSQTNSLTRAVKFCLGQSGQDLIHEAALIDRVMAAGAHPNIVPLMDAYLTGETPWLMFEYIGGAGAGDWIHLFAQMAPADRVTRGLKAIRQLATAVAFFHRLDPPIVHRDLKPANILYDTVSKLLRITDFGIGSVTSKEALDGAATTGGRLLTSLHGSHTPLYASPQQKAGGAPDPRDDVHALGVIAYQIITGHLDQGAGADFATDLAEAGAGPELIAVLSKCVAQRADRRWANAVEVMAQLTALTPKPVVPPVVGPIHDPPPPPPPVPPPVPVATTDPQDIAEEYPSFLAAWGTNVAVKSWLEKRLKRIDRWEEATRGGSPRASVLVAACHQYGVGTGKDDAEAMRLYRVAADAGVAEAMHMVGLFFDGGIGVTRNAAESLRWYQSAAAAGNTLSTVFAGDMHRTGNGIPVDLPTALRCYRTATTAGISLAMCRLGTMFQNGTGVTQDYGEALRWFQKAADAKDAAGMRELGNLYYYGYGVERDYLQAMVWYQRAAALGNADSMNDIGYMLERGHGMPVDKKEAEKWYARGASAGSAWAMANLGDMYFEGIPGQIKKTYRTAMDWYRKAADAGNAYACHQLGWMHQEALGVPRKDYPEALKWYRLGAERGYPDSMSQLAWFHEEGMGTDEDLAVALEWYEKAEQAGLETASKDVRRVRKAIKQPPATRPKRATATDTAPSAVSATDTPTEPEQPQ